MIFRRLIALGALVILLAATGSPAIAEEARMNAVQTALSSTTISGYVDTSVEWTLGSENVAVKSVEAPRFTRWWRAFRMWARNYGWR
jgi:hypothetical protein